MVEGAVGSHPATLCCPCHRPEESVSEIPVLPREVLQVLSQRLGQCVAQVPREEGAGASLGQALLLLKFFIIICRWVTPLHRHPWWGPGLPLSPPHTLMFLVSVLQHCRMSLRCWGDMEWTPPSLWSGLPQVFGDQTGITLVLDCRGPLQRLPGYASASLQNTPPPH